MYVMTHLHHTVFSELCCILGTEDATVNRVLRSLCQVKPSEIDDLSPAYFPSLPLAQSLLARVNSEQSPREKGALLCECLSCLPDASQTGKAMSMDDLLPLLNYLVIKSEIPNWLVLRLILRYRTSIEIQILNI